MMKIIKLLSENEWNERKKIIPMTPVTAHDLYTEYAGWVKRHNNRTWLANEIINDACCDE